MHRTTVYDVAELAGVSTATVSFTFRKPEKVKPETRDKVLRAAGELGYVPSANARGLARGKTGVLGLYAFDMLIEHPIGDDGTISGFGMEDDLDTLMNRGFDDDAFSLFTYPVYADEAQRGFELECWHRGRALLLETAKPSDIQLSVTDMAGRVDGLALFSNRLTSSIPLATLCRALPIVLLSEGVLGEPAASVSGDNEAGVGMLVDHLVDVHHVSDMRFVGSFDNFDARIRCDALRTHAHRRGCRVLPPLGDQHLYGREYFDSFKADFESSSMPDVLMCASDQIAFKTIGILRQMGLHVPDDVIVVGFDGIIAGRYSSPTLTTIRLPLERMGRLGAALLDERAGVPWNKPISYLLPVRLVVGESCGCGVGST